MATESSRNVEICQKLTSNVYIQASIYSSLLPLRVHFTTSTYIVRRNHDTKKMTRLRKMFKKKTGGKRNIVSPYLNKDQKIY